MHLDSGDKSLRVNMFQSVRRELTRLRTAIGAEHLAYHVISGDGPSGQQSVVFTTYPDEWVERYKTDYSGIDPVVKMAAKAIAPFDWSELSNINMEVARFFRDADKHGVGRNGITIPLPVSHARRAIITVTSNSDLGEWMKDGWEDIRHLFSIAVAIHERFYRRAISLQEVPLSAKEDECLQLLLQGLTPKEAASHLGVSASRVRAILKNSSRKLGCRTTAQTLQRAYEFGYLN